MYVRQLTVDEAGELYELRAAIAGLVGELIVKRGSADQLQGLCDLVDKMQVAADLEDTGSYYKLNLQFHDALVQAAGNAALQDTYKRIVNQLHLLRRRGLVQDGNLQVSNQEHRKIVGTLNQRDAVAAGDAEALILEGDMGYGDGERGRAGDYIREYSGVIHAPDSKTGMVVMIVMHGPIVGYLPDGSIAAVVDARMMYNMAKAGGQAGHIKAHFEYMD